MPPLTDKDKALLQGIVAAKTYPQIAHSQGVSLETIKTRVNRLRAKLGVSTKVELALWAARNLKG